MSMPSPKISILLPNLNNRPFLEERVRTIREQTIGDWELVVVDNFSDDGAWEFLRDEAARDPRWRVCQAPRRGMYANWNNCVRLARGKYVYIATSDDTMSPDCLERLAAALDEHPECDLAHCKLRIIDENGDPHPDLRWDKFYGPAYFGARLDRSHIRLAPHDGLLHCGVRTVYTSITQLLIRKSLFERIGLFRTDCGSIADFEWGMRVSLAVHTVHVPAYLATWRVHPDQGTDVDYLHSPECLRRLAKLAGQALRSARKAVPGRLAEIKAGDLKRLFLRHALRGEIQRRRPMSALSKARLGLKWALISPGTLRDVYRFARGPARDPSTKGSLWDPLVFSRDLLARYGVAGHVKLLE